MATKFQKNRKIIDIFTMQDIDISSNLKVKCKELGICYTAISKIERGEFTHINHRYITEKDLHKIFILVDVDSNIEYNCINNKSLFLQLNYRYNENEAKYVYELKSGRQRFASICDKVFKIKSDFNNTGIKKIKNNSEYINNIILDTRKQKQLKNSVYSKINKIIRNKYKLKNPSIEKIIGCNTSYFLEYIKSKFVNGMSMNNYGDWHIDHIIPCCMYDLKKKGEIEKSSHYTNLQPLWGTTKIAEKYGHKNYIGNINKSAKIN